MQLGFNLSNGVTDKLESISILIYLIQVKGIHTQKVTVIKTGMNTKRGIITNKLKSSFLFEGKRKVKDLF